MNNNELNRQAQRIKYLIDATSEYTDNNLELQGHWGKYLCVLVAGFLENAVSETYIRFASCTSSPPVASYTSKMLTKISNPKAAKFVDTAYLFKTEWGNELEEYFKDNPGIKNAIDSIMNNRHQIAHGKETAISVSRVREYFESSIDAIEFIEEQCGSS